MTWVKSSRIEEGGKEYLLLKTPLISAERVLLVEDEWLIAMDVEQMCREHGVKFVRVIHSYDELAKEIKTGSDIDAAILDVKISGQLTLDFARLLRERRIPFIFATGYSDMPVLSGEFPDVPVVSKPYAGKQLVEALAAVVGSRPKLRDCG